MSHTSEGLAEVEKAGFDMFPIVSPHGEGVDKMGKTLFSYVFLMKIGLLVVGYVRYYNYACRCVNVQFLPGVAS